jgi:hypothetical protein
VHSALPGVPTQVSSAVLSLLRGEVPRDDAPPEKADACLRELECGGYLHSLWSRTGGTASLPRGWSAALERAHRKTVVDTLAALADFRAIGRLLEADRIPFILMKGSAYLIDLYDDPGQRALTDIDLLVRPADASRVHRLLQRAGYATLKWDDSYHRFEVVAPGRERCRCEVHWRLGLSERTVDQQEIWNRAQATVLEGIPCLRLAPEHALLYHVAHQADHFFGPSLKWTIDLRLMFRQWPLDEESLLDHAGGWRVRTALSLALLYLEKLFPGEAPAGLRAHLGLGRLRRWLVHPFLDTGPLRMMSVGNGRLPRYVARGLLLDHPADIFRGMARALLRPFLRHDPDSVDGDGISTRSD